MSSDSKPCVEVCLNDRGELRPSCLKSGSRALLKELKAELSDQVRIKPSTCFGWCQRGPVVKLGEGFHGDSDMVPEATLKKVLEAISLTP